MAFTNLFRRHSCLGETQGTNYVCMDENSIAETLLDELESQCQHSSALLSSSKSKRNSEVVELSGGYRASTHADTTTAASKRRSSADYSWLTPQNNLFQTQPELYHLPDIIKMELGELIRNIAPEDCTNIVNQFRRHIHSQTKLQTPESIIALFRKILADYIDRKQKHHSNADDTMKNNEGNSLTSTLQNSLIRNNRILPKHHSDEEQHSIAELAEISLTSSQNDSNDAKLRSSTYA